MVWVGSFESLRSRLHEKRRFSGDVQLVVRTWLRSEIELVSPFVEWLTDLVNDCIREKAYFVELALREALSNAMLHGHHGDVRKLVKVRCCCERGRAVSIVVRDQGEGFDVDSIPNPALDENLTSPHGRGILLMRTAMDDVSFERRGTEVHMRKKLGPEPAASLAR